MADLPRPHVTAVVATKDRLELLARAVEAIIQQRYDGVIETIVVIDGGDHPLDLVQDDERRPVHVVANDRAPGLAGARNTGILRARGELIGFCDDDDVWHADKIAAQVELLERHPEALLCVTGMTIVREGHRIDRVHPSPLIEMDELVRARVQEAHPSSFLLRRQAFDQLGLVNERLAGSYGEDRDLLLRVARVGPVHNVPRSLLDVHWHAQSFFADRWATIGTAIGQTLEDHPELVASPRSHGRLLGRQAFALAASGDRRAAAGTAGRALRRWPGDRRAWVALAVASGALSASRAQRLANSVGRGI